MPPSCIHNITFTHIEITYDTHTHTHTLFHTKDGIYGLEILEWKVRQIYKSLTPEPCGRKRRPSVHPSLASTCGCGHTPAYMHARKHPYAHTHTHMYPHVCM